MNWTQAHAKSERIATKAQMSRSRQEAQDLYLEAAEHEQEALDCLDESLGRTFSITVVSLASLYFKAGAMAAARAVIQKGLDHPNVMGFARKELRELLRDIDAPAISV